MKKYDVLAIGELNVDLLISGLNSMPIVGREIIAEDSSIVLGSSTAITASWLAKLGLKVGIIGKVGKDAFADVVMEGLKANHIDTEHVIVDESIRTGLTISLSTAKDRALVTHMGSIEELTVENIDFSLLDQTKHIHVGSYFLQHRLRAGLPLLFAEAHKRGVTTSLDVGWDDTDNWDYGIADVLQATDIFLPNESEATRIAGKEDVQEALMELAKHAKQVVIKCGAEGASGVLGEKYVQLAGFKVIPVDTTGAGDSFNAGFIYGFLNGHGLEKSILYGNACGSINVTHIGGATAQVGLADVDRLLESRQAQN
ncbi:MAG: putative carbohydrate kinase [Paenibacillus sp.]|nr:putative carbohydrate kinase [Paenibacillus sp.]